MPLNLDIVIETVDYEVDMKAGLETLQGASEATLSIVETLVTGKVALRHRGVSSVRTILKRTFKGSYGQVFAVEISDEELQREYKKIGNATFVELMSYFMKESLYLESDDLSAKAQKIVDSLGDSAEALIKKLRVSSMENLHKVSTKFDHDVKIRYRKSLNEKVVIASFNKSTVLALQATESDKSTDITASITRLNITLGTAGFFLKERTKQWLLVLELSIKKLGWRPRKSFLKT